MPTLPTGKCTVDIQGTAVQETRADRRIGRIIGRDAELRRVAALLAPAETTRALVLLGPAGAGKSTILESGIDMARDRGILVLAARPTDAETAPAFGSLTDLLDDIDIDIDAEGVPEPQRHALEVATRRVAPDASPPEAFTISAGLLNVIRARSRDRLVLIAIDDAQWLDAPSEEALIFCARRLRRSDVRFLLARRVGPASRLELALEIYGVEQVLLGPVSLGAARALLLQRLGFSPSRRLLRRIVDTAQGNPAFILELVRTLSERGADAVSGDLPMPALGDNPFDARIRGASGPVRDLLLAIALAGDLGLGELGAIAPPPVVEEARDEGLLVVEGQRVRAAHPLVSAAARDGATALMRRSMHRTLGHVLADEARRIRHLAISTDVPDADLAAAVEAGVDNALARGAPTDAADLAEHALRLTAPGSPGHDERLLKLAECLERVGDQARLVTLLAPAIEELPPGPSRARAHLLLVGGSSPDEHEAHLEQALPESAGDPALRARIIESRAILAAGIRGIRIREAEAWLADALPLAHEGGPAVESLVVHSLAWVRMLRGIPIDDLVLQLERGARNPLDEAAVGHLVAQRHLFRGEIDIARESFRRLLVAADERGEARYLRLHFQLCGLELRAGAADAAAELLREEAEWFGTGAGGPRTQALLAAARGNGVEADERAATAIAESEASGYGWSRLEALRARGIGALARGDPAAAAESLGDVWAHAAREGFDNPGIFPVAPDLVEALCELDRRDEARDVTTHLTRVAEEQDHPWAAAGVFRCRAAIAIAEGGDLAAAEKELETAAEAYAALGLHFDEGRTHLLLGRALRRARRWGRARETLSRAIRGFERNGCPGWAQIARHELERVGARRPSPAGALSPAETRVAELATQGMSNKEIAAALFVSVYTVEAHLTHAYAKLGVRSRAQLAHRFGPNR